MTEIVAVDGGGSRCRLAVFDVTGQRLAQVTIDENASLTRGVQQAWLNIAGGLSQLATQLNRAPDWLPDRLMLGLAGSLQEVRRENFLALLPAEMRCTLITDGHAQLLGASAGQPAVCLAVGTGSVLHWLDNNGESGQVGGWGFPIGDEGSGSWIGSRLVQHYLWYHDGKGSRGTLMSDLEQRLGVSVSAIQQWSTETRGGVLAQLAPLAFEHADQGDELALSVLHEAAEYCLELLALAPTDLPIYIVGGIGEKLHQQIARALERQVLQARGDALQGLWQLSRDDGAGDQS